MHYLDFPCCPADAGEALDEIFFGANLERKYRLREALTGEVDAMRAEAGEVHFLEPGQVGFIVARRYRDSTIRFPFAVTPECRDELLAEADSEDSCREGFFRLAFVRAHTRVAHQYDWERKGATLQ